MITIGTGSGAGFAQGATAGFDPGDTTVRAVIDASDTPTCTYTNSPGLARDREAERGRHRAFDFTGTGAGLPATFTRDTAGANPTANAAFTFTAAQFGTKDVVETPEPGFTLTNIVCTANGAVITIGTGSGGSFASPGGAGFNAGDTTVRAVVDAGDTPTCTYTNTADASLDVEKQSVGGTATFDFTRHRHRPPGHLHPGHRGRQPHDQRAVRVHRPPARDQGRRGDARARLHAHEHRLRRQRRRDHHRHRQRRQLRSPGGAGFDPGDTTVRAVIDAGDTPTCTYTNTQNASLDIEKQSVGGTATFDYAGQRRRPRALHPRHRGRQPDDQRAVHLHRPPVRDQGRPGDARARLDADEHRLRRQRRRITIGTGIGGSFAQGATAGFDPGDTTVRAVIDAGDTPTCTFTNTKNASLDDQQEDRGR